ncbi:hypothetical protein J3458_016610 [Metarhizium acridum]|uniref:uncharacterized protein n=1 Tax=Metarhizium acridum TaxID=92637 RepID=UPI001C6CE465|nr:hypothetical protein J3458_016610 [Metarhizium acridum]
MVSSASLLRGICEMDSQEDWVSDERATEEAEVDLLEPDECEPESVYVTLHRVRRLVLASIDDPYTLDHFRQPNLNALIVRPLVDRLYETQNISIGKSRPSHRPRRKRELRSPSSFQCTASSPTASSSSSPVRTRHNKASTEPAPSSARLVATRVIRRFHEDNPGNEGLLLLAQILVEGFDPFDGAPYEVEREGRYLQWPIQRRGGHERKLTALELAILSESKAFISSAACQRLVEAVHVGKVVYTPLSFMDILPDHYKHPPDPALRPARVAYPQPPAPHRAADPRPHRNGAVHGPRPASLWSFLDVTFVAIYGAYVLGRVYDVLAGRLPNGYGLHMLCVAAPILLTRIAFNVMPHNIVFISLHAMMKDFTLLTFLAVWCFLGFLLALLWLYDADRADQTSATAPPPWPTVGKWLLWIWFGLDGTGIAESVRFNMVLGPALMIAFAFLGNTLFLTILVAILTNTFSHIVANEAAEIRFRRTVLTFEGVKSDSLFAYPPPFNMLAVLAVLPLKFLVSPRFFHTINVALIRVLNGPLLVAISIFERRRLWAAENKRRRPAGLFRWRFTGFSPHGDIQAVFTAPLPDDVSTRIHLLDPVDDVPVLEDDVMSTLSGDVSRSRLRRPKLWAGRREYPRARPRRRSPLRFQV